MFEQQTYQYFEDVNWGLLRLWGDRSGRDVLDAGCGFATTSQYIQRRARQLLDAAGLEEQRRTYNPGLLRPFVPLAKKLLTRRRGDGPVDPDALLGSRPYKLYVKTAYPIESAVARLWPGALAFQMI